VLFDPDHALDLQPRSRRGGIGAAPCIRDRQPQRFPLHRGAILQIEPDVPDRGRARRNRDVQNLADPVQFVDAHFDAVSREVAA
jgi:hypothetical protein